jgi:hypothetical protein
MAIEMKNMAYWKRKNGLPGINHESDKNLPDGRPKSSPFQKEEEKEEKKKKGKKAATTPLSPRRGHLSYIGLKGLPPLIK